MPIHLELIQNFFTAPAAPAAPGSLNLARLLKIKAGELANVRMGNRYYYRHFAIPKSDGRERHIVAPSPALKELQQRLLRRYLAHLPVHPAATAFMPGASILRNAQRHAGRALVATVDLTDFFGSTTSRRVRAFFVHKGWRGEALATLMRLCVYRNGLPQGAPTSPCLSNLVNTDLDAALDELARQSGASYTRYGDDLTFSWAATSIPTYFRAAVTRELLLAGYQIQTRKDWRVTRASDAPVVTGLVLDRRGRIKPSQRIRNRARRLCWQAWWQRLLGRDDAAISEQLRGYWGFFKMFEP